MTSKMKKQASPSLSGSQTTEQLLHELQVHQIELEMQNEELRRTQVELKASQSRYFDLFDLAPVGYVVLSEKGLILEANLAAATQLGVARNALVKQPLTRFILPEDQDIYHQKSKQLFEAGAPQVCELRMLRPDADPFWARLEASVAQDAGGASVCRAVLGDITERKRAEEALRESEAKLKTIFEILPVGVSILNRERKIYYANTVLESILDISRERLFQGDHKSRSYLRPDGTPMPAEEFASMQVLKEQRAVQNVETGVVKEDGSVIWVSVSAAPGAFPDWKVVVVTSDITERKRAEDALRESQQLLEKTLASLLDAVFIIDADTVEIIDCNPAASEIFGYSRQEMVGRTTAFLHVDQAALEEFRQHLNPDVEEKGFLFMPEFSMKRKDGTVFPTEHSVVPLENEQGKRIGWVSVVRDITERARAEKELEQSRERLRALTAYWQAAIETERAYIAREIHDEFGQSMTALKMDLTWLANRLPEGDERVERLRGMNTLVDESIALMRRIATELRPGLLDDLGLNAALEWQAQEFSRRSGIPCKLNLPKDDLALDLALNTTLFRIFQETLTNIARHAQATRVSASLKQTEQTLVLTMRDNGRGITEGELNNPRSLGLLGLRERAVQWGGETTIRGIVRKGTTVTVRIPLPASPAKGGGR